MRYSKSSTTVWHVDQISQNSEGWVTVVPNLWRGLPQERLGHSSMAVEEIKVLRRAAIYQLVWKYFDLLTISVDILATVGVVSTCVEAC